MVDPSHDASMAGRAEDAWSSSLSDSPSTENPLQAADAAAPAATRRTAWQEAVDVHLSISWDLAAWVGLALLAVFSRFWNLGARVMSYDESLHVYYSWLLSQGGEYAHNPMMHGPLVFELSAVLERLLGANDFTVRLLPALAGIAVVIGAPLLLRPWLGKKGALAAGAMLLISPYVLYFSRYNRHDIQADLWMLVLVCAVFSYLARREDHYLVVAAAALALMLSAMEITFMYMAILAAFLGVRLLVTSGLSWTKIRQAAEFDLLVVLATLGAFFSSPIALLVLNPIFKAVTGQEFVDIGTVLSAQDASWLTGPAGPRLLSLFILFSSLALLGGIIWGGLRWVKLFAVFAVISVVLYTTFFTNWKGIFTGTIGSLGYWLSQHGVDRGSQPWYYYFIVFPLYEFLPLLGALAGGIYYAVRFKRLSQPVRIFVRFLLLWAALIFFGLTVSGEKMPWLSIHITIPCILAAAWWIGELLASLRTAPEPGSAEPRRSWSWLALAGLAGVAILAAATIRTSYRVNYVTYDYTTEFIDYAHGAPGVKWAVEDVQKIAAFTGEGKSMPVAYDDLIAWPMSWYLRDYPGFFGVTPTRQALNAPVVIVGENNWQKVDSWIGQQYHRYEVIRMWWPMEDYKDLTWQRIWYALTNHEMRNAVWQIIWNRDYRLYAALTNENLDPPRQWPLQDRMRVYIRKDIADQIANLNLKDAEIADVQAPIDGYVAVEKEIAPEKVVGSGMLSAPRNLAFGPDGELYAADSGSGRIVRLNPDGAESVAWGSKTAEGQTPAAPGTFNEPWGMAVDPSGNIYVADTWNHRIQKFDPSGKFLLEWGTPGLSSDGPDRFWGPRAVAVGKDGRVYVTDTGNKRVAVFDGNGKFLLQFDQEGDAALDEPVGLAIGPDGNIYVADTWNQRVAVFTPDGHFARSFPVQAWYSNAVEHKPYLAIDQAGRVYVTDPQTFRVLVFSADGQPVAAFGASGADALALPNGIAIAPDGTVWVADAGASRIVEYPAINSHP